jgi:hypothetical protein
VWRVRADLTDEAKVVADLLAQSLHDHSLRAPLAQYYRFASAQMEAPIKELIESLGLEARIEISKIPRLVHAMLDGLLMQKIVDPDAITEEFVIECLETMAAALFEPKTPA